MIERFVDNVTLRAFNQEVIKEKDIPVFRYGLQSLIEVSIILFTVLLMSKWLGRTIEAGVLVGTLIICRSFGGGYHAKSFKACYFISVCTFFIAILILNTIPSEWYISVTVMCSICSAFFIIIYSRTEGRIERKQFEFLEKVTSYICFFYFTFIIVAISFEIINASTLACALGFCIAQLSTLIKNKEVY